MLRVLLYAIPIVLAIFAIVDCLQTPDDQIRGLPRFGWLVLILFFPLIGSIVWLFAGRARGGTARQRVGWRSGPTKRPPDQSSRPTPRFVAPDDDPEFLSQLDRSNREHDALLEQWERDLSRREDDVRGNPAEPPPGDGPGDDAGPDSPTPRA